MPFKIGAGNNKDAYRNMGDEELLIFAKEEGTKLMVAGYEILKEELNRRHIGVEIIEQIEHSIMLEYALKQKKFEEDFNKELFISSVEYALNEKKNGKSQYEIYVGLVERGIEEPYANHMINQLDEWAESLHKDASLDLQAGIGTLVLGFVVLYITLKIERFEIGAVLIILIGILKIISSLDKKKKYRKIVERFQHGQQ